MKQFNDSRDGERREKKLAEKNNLQKRRVIRDKHYHPIEDDGGDEQYLIDVYRMAAKGSNGRN